MPRKQVEIMTKSYSLYCHFTKLLCLGARARIIPLSSQTTFHKITYM